MASSPSLLASKDESDDGFDSGDADGMMMMACLVMMRYLLDLLALCHL